MSDLAAAAACLDADVSAGEVNAALRKLLNGRAAGSGTFPAEFLRYAIAPPSPDQERPPAHVLAPHLAGLFTQVMRCSRVPKGWNTALVTPLLKRGDPAVTANYRPVAVGVPLVRLYAAILNHRLTAYLESNRLRAPTQAGFRPKLSVTHHLFALQHFVSKRQRQKLPLYSCFVDLTAAYDCVQHDLLWETLQRLGIGGRMFAAVQGLYAEPNLAMKVGGRAGSSQPARIGVRQGCPLSPTLFGVFMDVLHDYIEENAGSCGALFDAPHSQRQIVSHLMYADDIVLLADTPGDLQRLIDVISEFFAAVGLEVSDSKTQTMVFHSQFANPPPPQSFSYRQRQLPAVTEYKYLGVLFKDSGETSDGLPRVRSNIAHQHNRVRGKFAGLGCGSSMHLQLYLFDAFVTPAALYGCELWALHPSAKPQRQRLMAQYTKYIKQICRLPPTVANQPLLWELNRQPIERQWLRQCLNFWNRLCDLPAGSLHKDLLMDSQLEAIHYHGRSFAWCIREACLTLGVQLVLSDEAAAKVSLAAIEAGWRAQDRRHFDSVEISPRSCGQQAARCTFWRWFARTPAETKQMQPYRQQISPRRLRRYLWFRLSCSEIPVVLGRRTGVPRGQRACRLCGSGAVGDERHMVFECPALQQIRDEFEHLFSSGVTMRAFMNQTDQRAVISFVVTCLDIMDA